MIEKILTALTTPQNTTPECREILQFNDAILLQDIAFSYPAVSKPPLDHVPLNIPKGKLASSIGLSSSGKSILSAIIIGLMAPGSGQLIIDGKPWDSTAKHPKMAMHRKICIGLTPAWQRMWPLANGLGSVNTIEFLFACKEDKPALRECTLLVLDRKSR